jgi:hypothetical protein
MHDRVGRLPRPVIEGRRSFHIGLVGAAALSEVDVGVAADPASPDDERFMRMALEEARRADFPFGAVIVRNGSVIARARFELWERLTKFEFLLAY